MNDAAKTVVAGAIGLMALVLLARTFGGGCVSAQRYATADAKVKEAVTGHFAGAVSENHEPGKVVFIRFSGFIPATTKIQEIQTDAFTKALQGGGWDVVELPPEDMEEDAHGNWVLRTSGGNWGRDLLEWLAPHQDTVAVVSMVGLPNLSQKQWEQIPPFYAEVLGADAYSRGLLDHGYVNGLAVMREDGDPVAIRTFRGPRKELFDLAYTYLSSGP